MADKAQTNGEAQASPEKSFQVTPPQLDLPKGGSTMRAVVEKFAAIPVTGTGTLSVPIFAGPGLRVLVLSFPFRITPAAATVRSFRMVALPARDRR